jgi:hypothetical protein
MSSASDHVATRLLFENARLRVWEMTLAPGQASDWHRHPNDYVFVNLSPAQVTLFDMEGDPVTRGLDNGFVEYTQVGPGGQPPHQLVNAGEKHLRQVLIEFLGSSVSSESIESETNNRFL